MSFGWLDPSEARQQNYELLYGMTFDELDELDRIDPEFAEHLRQSFPDVVDFLYVKKEMGFGTTDEAKEFIEAGKELGMDELMAWGGFKTIEEAEAFLAEN